MLAGAGNETTGGLIGWLGKVLGDHPGRRRQIAADPSLIPTTVEETLRYEPTGPHVARYVARDVGSYWEVDDENARLAPTSTVRGWDTMPVVVTR